LEKSFQAAFILSNTSILWWCHAITEIASYLEEIKNLNEYNAIELRTAALKARRTWASFKKPGARRESAFRAPIEDNRYEGVIPSGLPFYFSLGTFGEDRQTCLVCRDLGNEGRVMGAINYHQPMVGNSRPSALRYSQSITCRSSSPSYRKGSILGRPPSCL